VSDTKIFKGLTAVMRAIGPSSPEARRPSRWSKVTIADLTAVEELLDWLENNGYDERRVDVAGDAFEVRWR
jgi:hypothetical protein